VNLVNSRLSHPATGELEIGPVPPETTYVLRQQVLRPHQRVEEMSLIGSDHPESVVIGAVVRESGEVVSTAAVSPEEAPPELAEVLPPGRRWRLRSMATRPDLRGSGIGRAVLDRALAHVESHGGGVLWCSARVPAAGFYERAGFVRFGEEWEPEHIGPHVLMWRTVDPA
jgi:ribosomal protein S18 acetylase RimI-like enzyme